MSEDFEVVSDLSPVGILSHVAPPDLETLKYYGVFGEFGVGEVIIEEGKIQNRLYILLSGRLQVTVKSSGTDLILGVVEPGDCLGEISIFEPGPASASVTVQETAVLWHLDVDSLQAFFEQLPVAGGQLMLGISQLLSKRLRQANAQIVQNKLPPQNLMERVGMDQPIRADNLGHGKQKAGFWGNLLGS